MMLLTLVLIYSAVMVFDGYLLCRSGIIKGPGYVCPETSQETVYVPDVGGGEVVGVEGRKAVYHHGALRLAFEYPLEWGPVLVREELGTDISGRRVIAGLMLSFSDLAEQSGGGLFMHANYSDADLASRRLDYWGTDAVRISSLYDLKGWCEGKSDCSYLTNADGIVIAKQKMNPGGVAGRSSFDVYHLYNPYGGYRGVALSTERLQAKFGAANLQRGFEELVASIRFLE